MNGRMKNNINVKGSGEMKRWGKENGWRSSGEMKRYGREKGWRNVNVKLKKIYIKNNYKKMERKKIMTWTLTWLNVSTAALNATFQLLVIYRLLNELLNVRLFIYCQIWDAYNVKAQTFKTAIEAASMLLRIDDIVSGIKRSRALEHELHQSPRLRLKQMLTVSEYFLTEDIRTIKGFTCCSVWRKLGVQLLLLNFWLMYCLKISDFFLVLSWDHLVYSGSNCNYVKNV